jgi:hypothetical protein
MSGMTHLVDQQHCQLACPDLDSLASGWWTLAMRAWPALFPVLAAVLAVTACSGSRAVHASSPVHAESPAARLTAQPQVGCDQIIRETNAPDRTIVLGMIAVPPAYLPGANPTGSEPWRYYWKYSLAIRANSPAVIVTIPQASRYAAAISWGNGLGPLTSLRLLSCPRQLGSWNVYAGGFYLRSAAGCVPVVFAVGRRAVTLRFGLGRRCSAAT